MTRITDNSNLRH